MKEKQLLLGTNKLKYSYGPYNKIKGDSQQIRITEGCPHNCPYCYEPQEFKIFDIPKIERNKVRISDMNLLCKREALDIIKQLGNIKVNKKVVYYELICGIDYRFLTQEIANELYKNRFINIRIASLILNWSFKVQSQAILMLIKAGYKSNDIMVFMICNWNISFKENCLKLDLLKVWNVKVHDAYYDNQIFPNVIPKEWTSEQNKEFRHKCRLHNQIVNFGIYPELN